MHASDRSRTRADPLRNAILQAEPAWEAVNRGTGFSQVTRTTELKPSDRILVRNGGGGMILRNVISSIIAIAATLIPFLRG
jgi:hypothetical protein